MKPLLAFSAVEKRFFGVPVLKQVSFDLGAGRVLGLVGENGAGKSTLMNLLGGNLRPDGGRMTYRGVPYAPTKPQDASAAGIGFVHQELNLFSNLSIAENLFLIGFPRRGPWIDRRALAARTQALLRRVGLQLSPSTAVGELTTGERQLVEIARALSLDAQLIILDEPTTSLSVRERDRLFDLVGELRTQGRSVIYISHSLGEVLRLCDDVVVLRDGEVAGRGPAGEYDHNRLVSLMVGRELKQLFPMRARWANAGTALPGEPLLAVKHISRAAVLQDVSFSLARGEVLGLSGLMGAGRTKLARVLFGLDPSEGGEITLNGEMIGGSPSRRIRSGLALLTENRREDGLCLEASVADNMALVTLARRTRRPLRLLDLGALRGALTRAREAVRLQPRVRNEQAAKTLSGGNQQKVVLAKWLLAEPQVLILDEPTRGIDVGAKFEIYRLIHELADRGAGVLLISSEMEELMGTCDRILVMAQGRITDDLGRSSFDRERVLRAALNA